MSDPAASTVLPDHACPRLLRGVRVKHDSVRGMDVLLAPERALKLDAVGAAILAELDGTSSFAEIVTRLAARYNAPAEQIAGDARSFLVSLIERRMAEAA
ncbi:pyrroloquinoline quinone biosynthesis peptide chaperone PqqD [Paroceanicella profunda]|uniref:Pyrroloquinoline quinone biosynthesis peptide chaperone PqqD n=1 Tax=Paroceanicella profunda TaxID=2579971 RepID=A0A5B8FV96_9RHOB|nr:pyrroloquinoline quinone biosynthesis peptide chaperone PqqD [Paroceanicella profunda]QDL92345.1 pyrroloquinoline quinone biosynthesis peptide chaperone PqqD [Paroceanicella profunda]